MPTRNEDLDRLAAKAGFQFKPSWDDFLYSDEEKATKKAKALAEFINVKQKVDTGDARAELLGGTAFAGTNATPEEISAFKPGRPLDRSTRPDPTPGLPAGTVDPALATDLQTQLRDEELNRAGTRNAPAVERMRQQLAYHDAGISGADVAGIALGRVRDVMTEDEEVRSNFVKKKLGDPDLDPLLGIDIAQNKAVFKPKLVKVEGRDGKEIYMHETPSLSGRPTYTPALDKQGQPLRVPESEGRIPQNVKFMASIWYPDEPDGPERWAKAADRMSLRKGLSREASWEHGIRVAAKRLGRAGAQDPQKVYDLAMQEWRLIHPGVPPPVPRPDGPAPGAAGAAPAGQSATKPAAPPAGAPTTAANYRTADEVKAAYKGGRLPREEAMRLLKGFGFE